MNKSRSKLRSGRNQKVSPLWFFVNLVRSWSNNPNYRGFSFLISKYNLVVIAYLLVCFQVYYAVRHWGVFPDLLKNFDASTYMEGYPDIARNVEGRNYYELYLDIIDYTAYPSMILLFVFLLWLNTHYPFKKYDYARPRPSGNNFMKVYAIKKMRQVSPPYEITTMIFAFCCGVVFLVSTLFPSFVGTFFYQGKFNGAFIPYYNSSVFIFIAGLWIAFWQNLCFQMLLMISSYFLSAVYHSKKVD